MCWNVNPMILSLSPTMTFAQILNLYPQFPFTFSNCWVQAVCYITVISCLAFFFYVISQSFCVATVSLNITWVLWSGTPWVIFFITVCRVLSSSSHITSIWFVVIATALKYQWLFVHCKVILPQQPSMCSTWSNFVNTTNNLMFNERLQRSPYPHRSSGNSSSNTLVSWEETLHADLTIVRFVKTWQNCFSCMSSRSSLLFSSDDMSEKVCKPTNFPPRIREDNKKCIF